MCVANGKGFAVAARRSGSLSRTSTRNLSCRGNLNTPLPCKSFSIMASSSLDEMDSPLAEAELDELFGERSDDFDDIAWTILHRCIEEDAEEVASASEPARGSILLRSKNCP